MATQSDSEVTKGKDIAAQSSEYAYYEVPYYETEQIYYDPHTQHQYYSHEHEQDSSDSMEVPYYNYHSMSQKKNNICYNAI